MADESKKTGLTWRIVDAGMLVLVGGMLFNAGIQYQRINDIEEQVEAKSLSTVPARLAAIDTQLREMNKRLNYLTQRIDEVQ